MRTILAAVLLAGVSAAWAAPGADFTYKGLKVGDSAQVVREKLPTYQCREASCEYSMRECVRAMARDACDTSASFGGAWVNNGIIRLHEGKVIAITLYFTQSMVAAVADASAQAFGAPGTDEVKEFQTRAGVKAPSWNKVWSNGDQALQVAQRVGDIETGMASITSAEGRAILEQARKARAEKGSKDF